jgi:hypothetical protein
VIVEILDPPFAHARQVRMFERYRCAHHGLPRQVGEAGFGRAQEAFGHVQPSVFGQIDELLYQVAPRGRALGDQRHQRGFFRASTLAKASLRMALQSAGVSSLSAPLMHLRKHDLLQMNDEWLKKLPAELLLEVSKRLLDDVKELHDRLNQNPDNSSRPPTSQAPWERASDAEVDQDSPPRSTRKKRC